MGTTGTGGDAGPSGGATERHPEQEQSRDGVWWKEKEPSSDTVTKWFWVKFLDTYSAREGTSKRWQEVKGG